MEAETILRLVALSLTVAFGVVRLAIWLLRLVREIASGRKLRITANIDRTGFVLIKAASHWEAPITIQTIELVEDESRWRFVLRKVIGIDKVMRFRRLEWTKRFTLPETVPSKETRSLHGQIDTTKHDLGEIYRRKLKLPLLRMEIAGRVVLKEIVRTTESLFAEQDRFDPNPTVSRPPAPPPDA